MQKYFRALTIFPPSSVLLFRMVCCGASTWSKLARTGARRITRVVILNLSFILHVVYPRVGLRRAQCDSRGARRPGRQRYSRCRCRRERSRSNSLTKAARAVARAGHRNYRPIIETRWLEFLEGPPRDRTTWRILVRARTPKRAIPGSVRGLW